LAWNALNPVIFITSYRLIVKGIIMKKFTTTKSIRLLFAAGLLIAALAQLLSRYIQIPDVILGGFIGIGVGIEIIALVMLKKMNPQKNA
jgi:hypothetical protein